MGSKKAKAALVAALTAFSLAGLPSVVEADHGEHLDLSVMDYTPIGYYGPQNEAGGDPDAANESTTIPAQPGPYPMGSPFIDNPNPSGKWVAYDTNVWESLALPSRHPGDNCNSLSADQQHPDCREGDKDADNDGPSGYAGPSGAPPPKHGECPPPPAQDPEFAAFGECFNNQLEYLDYYENAMETELADFGVTVKRYGFHSPGGGLPRGAYLAAAAGQAYNIGAVVPGATHPEQTVLVSGHYDFTDSGPAAAWDSAEGHTEVMRMAYLMADYWRKTGTRPAATVKFIPWDSEESGTFGSADYVANNIPPGEEDKVRAYFNVDPCAGAYPAYKDHNFNERIPQVMQLANPDEAGVPRTPEIKARMQAFNAKAEIIVDQVMDRLDDTITTPTGERPIFVSDAEAAAGANGGDSQRDEIVTAVGGLLLFSSDYDNFQDVGIPIFNFFPDYFGPHADGTPGASNEGVSILHTPNDNLTRINRLTSGLNQTVPSAPVPDPTGLFASEGWAKGQEFCAQTEAWYMLQPEMVGAQTRNTDVVAYYEALPNEAQLNKPVTFDASETYQYADATARTLVPESELTYTWDFGDGTTLSGTGPAFKVVQHTYTNLGRYETKLTVTGRSVSSLPARDSMGLPVVVVGNVPNPLACVEPGVTILTDPTGDVNPQTGDPRWDDIERLSIAEPAALGPGKIVFTLKMARLTEPLPNNRTWPVLLRSKNADFTARMSTWPDGVKRFSVAPGTTRNPTLNPGTPADPASSSNTDGTIRIVVNRSQIGNPPPFPAEGSTISMFLTRISIHGGAVDLTPDNMPNDLVRAGTYTLIGSENCVTNREPVAVNDAATTRRAVPVTINVLANDGDPDGDPLTVTGVTDPPNGTATRNPDNTVTYRPRCGFTGNDSFFYTISDGKGGTDSALVTVVVRRTSRAGSC